MWGGRFGFRAAHTKRVNEFRLRCPAESLKRSLNFQVARRGRAAVNLGCGGSLQPGLCCPPCACSQSRQTTSLSNKREFLSAVFPSWLPPTRLGDFFTPQLSGRKQHTIVPVGIFKINVILTDHFKYPVLHHLKSTISHLYILTFNSCILF